MKDFKAIAFLPANHRASPKGQKDKQTNRQTDKKKKLLSG